MKERELRRTMAVFPIGAVMKLTDLTARQIRYYEDQGLITPERTEGNRRMFSLNDMDRLLEIKDFISDGLHISDIKNEYMQRQHKSKEKQKSLSDAGFVDFYKMSSVIKGVFQVLHSTLEICICKHAVKLDIKETI